MKNLLAQLIQSEMSFVTSNAELHNSLVPNAPDIQAERGAKKIVETQTGAYSI
jgi:hypothetical protein